LRALIMHLEKMTPAQILEFEIGTGQPRMYELNSDLSVNKAYNL
jgi:2,3-bisphosphoglycerate-dependent phosphoglycerate mutase